MDKAEFDKFADEYRSLHANNIQASGEDPEFFAEYKIIDAAVLAKTLNLEGKLKILDFGSGIGNSVPFFKKHFPLSDLTCVDVSERSIEISKERFPKMADYQVFDGIKLPFSNNHFDIIFTACVFHHIDEDIHIKLFSEIRRALKKGGILIVFEHNPWNPLTVRAVNDCPFDENAKLISAPNLAMRLGMAGFSTVKTKYRIFFPKILKKIRFIEPYIGWLPLGAQYYAVGRKNELD